jgi:Flp pilus assembly protein TadD
MRAVFISALVLALAGCTVHRTHEHRTESTPTEAAPPTQASAEVKETGTYEQRGDVRVTRAEWDEAIRFYGLALAEYKSYDVFRYDANAVKRVETKKRDAEINGCHDHLAKGQAALASGDRAKAIIDLRRAKDLSDADSSVKPEIDASLAKANSEPTTNTNPAPEGR